jgi:hypothetical protein
LPAACMHSPNSATRTPRAHTGTGTLAVKCARDVVVTRSQLPLSSSTPALHSGGNRVDRDVSRRDAGWAGLWRVSCPVHSGESVKLHPNPFSQAWVCIPQWAV